MGDSAALFTWEFSWWSASAPWLIFIFGYLTFFVMAYWVFDMNTMKSKLITVGTIWTGVIVSMIVFIPALHWVWNKGQLEFWLFQSSVSVSV